MNVLDEFELSAGSIPGRHHLGHGNLLKGSNNQDAYGYLRNDSCIVATVHDGCSAGRHSEVGAKLAAIILVKAVEDAVQSGSFACTDEDSMRSDLDHTLKQLLRRFRRLSATIFGVPLSDTTVHDYLLCTTVALVVTKTASLIFSMGDGFYCLNGAINAIDPSGGNEPPYFGYHLLKSAPPSPALNRFTIHALKETGSLENALIATDGFKDLLISTQKNMPGKDCHVGSVAQLWLSDRFFASRNGEHATGQVAESITPWLRQLNSEVTRLHPDDEAKICRERGLLSDDTTIVVLRRRKTEAGESS